MKNITLLFILILAVASKSLACHCDDPGTIKESLKNTPNVVYGRVLDKKLVSWAEIIEKDSLITNDQSLRKSIKNANFIDAKQLINVKFLILKIYKGHFESDTITILTGINGAMCGYTSFEKNKAYIVYGFSKRNVPISISLNAIVENKNTIWTTHCTRTTDNVEPEIIELNKLKRKAFVAQLRGDLSHKKYVWSEDKADIPKAVFDYLNAWKLKNTNEKHGFTIVNPKEEYDCCCTTDHALPPRQLIKIAKKDNQWIIVYWHGQGIVTNEKILCLNLDEKDEVSFFNFNTEVKTKNIQQSIFLQIKNENLCLFNGDSSGCPYFSDF